MQFDSPTLFGQICILINLKHNLSPLKASALQLFSAHCPAAGFVLPLEGCYSISPSFNVWTVLMDVVRLTLRARTEPFVVTAAAAAECLLSDTAIFLPASHDSLLWGHVRRRPWGAWQLLPWWQKLCCWQTEAGAARLKSTRSAFVTSDVDGETNRDTKKKGIFFKRCKSGWMNQSPADK